MEDKKEYLNEEKFQKANKKVKTAGAVILLIGLCMLIGGIIILTTKIIKTN